MGGSTRDGGEQRHKARPVAKDSAAATATAGGPVGRMTTAQYAQRVGVSDRTLRYWCEKGMPHERETYPDPRKPGKEATRIVIDVVAADAWRTLHIAEGKVGGKRPGAGRKPPGKPPPTPTTTAANTPASPSSPSEESEERHKEKTFAQLRNEEMFETIREKRLRNEAAEGNLVPRADVRAQWSEFVTRAAGIAARAPDRASEAAAHKAGLTREQQKAVKAALTEQMHQLIYSLSGVGATRISDEAEDKIERLLREGKSGGTKKTKKKARGAAKKRGRAGGS